MHRSRTPVEIRGALIGTLLGDSYIRGGRTFSCEQTNLNLIKLKAKLISHYTKNFPNISERQRASVINGRTIKASKTYVVGGDHNTFKKWSKIFYMFGERQIRMSLLRRLTLEGIAMWIMDDGFMYYTASNCTRRLTICTDAYSELSHKLMVKYFKDYHDLNCKIIFHQADKDSPKRMRIAFSAKSTQKLISLIHEYVLDDFLYKLDMHYSEKSLNSLRCIPEYKEAHESISQRMALYNQSKDEDIV